MPTRPMSTVVKYLRRAVLLKDGAGQTDGQLLAWFIRDRDEAAFEALVRRHGPMVMSVCRRLLPNHHDVEDAFQATFLVLVRKAASIVPQERVANWLHGVAYNTALKAKAMSAKRSVRERQVMVMPEPEAPPQAFRHELRLLLDQELIRLPDKYRLPIILCDLEGRAIKEAARQLGCPQGTLAGRLARGRKMLARRLARHGLMLSGGALAAALSENAASACVSAFLLGSTAKAVTLHAAGQAAITGLIPVNVAALTEGVVITMLLTKLKTVTMVLVVLAMVAFGGSLAVTHATAKAQPSQAQQADAKPPILPGLAAPKSLDKTESAPQVPPAAETPQNAVLSCFNTSFSPIFEGGAVGKPIRFTLEIRAEPELKGTSLGKKLADKVKEAVKSAMAEGASEEPADSRLDEILKRLERMERRLEFIARQKSASDGR